MGELLVYYPQEHYYDKPALPEHKRANELSGLSGAESILYGLFGINHKSDGSLWINPQPPSKGYLKLNGHGFKGNKINLNISEGYINVIIYGKNFYEGDCKEMKIL